MTDLAKIDAVLAAGHPDTAKIGISVGLLRALAADARRCRDTAAELDAANALRSANAKIVRVIDQLHNGATA